MTSAQLTTPASHRVSDVKRGGIFRRALLVLVVSALFAAAIHEGVPLCPSAALFGLPCPGCGLTRATLLLAHGEWAAALHMHPLVLVLAPLYFGALGAAAFAFVVGPLQRRLIPLPQGFWTRAWITRAALLMLAVTLGVWVARFFGAFGGPVPVHSLFEHAHSQHLR